MVASHHANLICFHDFWDWNELSHSLEIMQTISHKTILDMNYPILFYFNIYDPLTIVSGSVWDIHTENVYKGEFVSSISHQ